MAKRLFVGVVVLAFAASLSAQSKSSIQGVWRVTETTGGLGAANDKAVNAKPQPGFYIFTATHYSVNRVYGDKPRMVPKDAAKPTIEELTDANRMQAQFGTYQLTGDAITMKPIVARQPATMNAAASVAGTAKIAGNMLTLTLKNAAGAISVVKMTKVE